MGNPRLVLSFIHMVQAACVGEPQATTFRTGRLTA